MVAFIFKSLGDAKEDIRARASTCYVCMFHCTTTTYTLTQ